jgi:hypothetical protein
LNFFLLFNILFNQQRVVFGLLVRKRLHRLFERVHERLLFGRCLLLSEKSLLFSVPLNNHFLNRPGHNLVLFLYPNLHFRLKIRYFAHYNLSIHNNKKALTSLNPYFKTFNQIQRKQLKNTQFCFDCSFNFLC